MSYVLTIINKRTTVDDFEKGEIGKSNNFYIGQSFTDETIEGVIRKACDFVGGKYEGEDRCWLVEIDANIGRIDFQTLEDGDANTASKGDIEQWKKGNKQLWSCYYVGRIEKVTPVDLTDFQK